MSNLDLWNKVFTTDMKYTKQAKKGAYSFTSIAPMYQKMRATEALGPQGVGWGVEVGSETFDYKEVGTTTLLVYRAVMFYVDKGERGRIPIAAMEKLCYQTQGDKGYLKIDDEADKKVKTSALTKGLSEIGVSADIFMGLHENWEYSELAAAKIRMDGGDEEEIRAANDEFKEWFDKKIKGVLLCPNENAINLVVNRVEPAMNDRLTILKASPEKRALVKNKLYNSADNAKKILNDKLQGKK